MSYFAKQSKLFWFFLSLVTLGGLLTFFGTFGGATLMLGLVAFGKETFAVNTLVLIGVFAPCIVLSYHSMLSLIRLTQDIRA